jgi:hypothetical protein
VEEFKELNKLNLLLDDCHEAIKRQGGHARITFRVPGKRGKQTHKRLFPRGPKGKILAETNDRNKLIVLFVAAEVITKLEELKNGIVTSGN